jgi:hypothetical protein
VTGSLDCLYAAAATAAAVAVAASGDDVAAAIHIAAGGGERTLDRGQKQRGRVATLLERRIGRRRGAFRHCGRSAVECEAMKDSSPPTNG